MAARTQHRTGLGTSARVYFLLRLLLTYVLVSASLLFGVSAHAQSLPDLPPPPSYAARDAIGVDLIAGTMAVGGPQISIGRPGYGALTYRLHSTLGGTAWQDNLHGGVHNDGVAIIVTVMGVSTRFAESGGVFTPKDAQGGSLTLSAGTYTFTSRDGLVATFAPVPGTSPLLANLGRILTLTYPSGEKLTYHWQTNTENFARLSSVTSNLGYQIKLFPQSCIGVAFAECRLLPGDARAINNIVQYCDPVANSCAGLSTTWPRFLFRFFTPAGNWSGQPTVTDSIDRVWTLAVEANSINSPSGSGAWAWYLPDWDGKKRVWHAASAGSEWTYNWSRDGDVVTATATDPLGHQRVVTASIANSRILSDTIDPGGLNRTTSLQYDSFNRLIRVTHPEGNYTHYTYDARGNVTEVRRVAKPGSGLAGVVTTAVYPSICDSSNFRICNRPISVTDPRENTTDFTYDPAHGGVLTITGPAVNSVRPQTRYTYQALYAWYKNSSGAIVQAPSAVYRLTQISQCANSSSCTNQAEEVRTTIAYQPGNSSAGSNLLPVSVTTSAGSGAMVATTTTTYDEIGNVRSVDGPLPGNADTVQYEYDAARQLTRVVEPDPDGDGSRKPHYTAMQYNPDGLVSSVEDGVVDVATPPARRRTTTYDSRRLAVEERLAIGGTVQSVIQYSYDSANRLECAARRMNPAAYGSLPSSACFLSAQGPAGPDRIEQYAYDNANALTSIVTGYGTGEQREEVRYAYTQNGQRATITDGNNNRSTYVYDGFDRLQRLRFPVGQLGADTSSTTDYEEYGYDPNGNLTSLRQRNNCGADTTCLSNNTINFSYDPLNRQVIKDMPGGTSNDVYSAYDLLGRPLSVRHGSPTGAGTVYDYSTPGIVVQTAYGRTLRSQFDVLGHRTRLTYPDHTTQNPRYIDYTYDILGRLDQMRENGAISGPGLLVDFDYDDLGRRTAIARGNGTTTSATFSASSRDWSLGHDFSGTAQDLTLSFSHNPAGQAVSRTRSNDAAYIYSPSESSRTYARNGLNQYSNVAGAAYQYDARGNLTSDSSRNFAYDLENRLTTVSGSASMTLSYDPLGRLRQTVSGGTTTQFLYDGNDLVAEYDGSGNLLRRYAHGTGADEPLVWYQGVDLTNRNWLHADEQGSIVATSNSAGAATTYTYSPFGEPGGSDWTGSRFRYTGQIALSDAPGLRLYHYKARVYDPALGRFLQTDPIGYGARPNLYGYVGNDPINALDPSGLVPNDIPNWADELVNEEIVVTAMLPSIGIPHVRGDGWTITLDCELGVGCFGGQDSSFAPWSGSPDQAATFQLIQESSPASSGECAAAKGQATATWGASGALGGALIGAGACSELGPVAAACAGVGAIIGGGAGAGGGNAAAGALSSSCHGNSLKSGRPTWVYQVLSNRDNALLKYGMTSLADPILRYPFWVYAIGNARLEPIGLYPDRASARAEELRLCNTYVANNGHMPPWSMMC